MQTVVAAGLVMQYERRSLFLAGFMTAHEKFLMVERKWLAFLSQLRIPIIRYFRQVRIGCCPERLNAFRQRITKIFVVAFAKAKALHHNVTAKVALLRKKRDERIRLPGGKKSPSRSVAGLGELFCRVLPINRIHTFLNKRGCWHKPTLPPTAHG